MPIRGIGTDITRLDRIERIYQRFGARFVARILSPDEQQQLSTNGQDLVPYLAKRFAAKEAIGKALGTGIGPVVFNEISILNLPSGQPTVTFSGQSAEFVVSLSIGQIHISLTDEKEHALAFAVVEYS